MGTKSQLYIQLYIFFFETPQIFTKSGTKSQLLREFFIDQFVNFKFSENSSNKSRVT